MIIFAIDNFGFAHSGTNTFHGIVWMVLWDPHIFSEHEFGNNIEISITIWSFDFVIANNVYIAHRNAPLSCMSMTLKFIQRIIFGNMIEISAEFHE